MKTEEFLTRTREALAPFSGQLKLFPLPSLVMFPMTVVPLQIFEPRYRKLLADALASDRFMGVVLLAVGWEEDYYGLPPISGVTCVSRIIQDQTLPDGKESLMLEGLSRARIDHETQTDPYRIAQVTLLEDIPIDAKETADWNRRFKLLTTGSMALEHPHLGQTVTSLLDSNLPFASVVDIISAGLPLDPQVKQEVLEELDVSRRSSKVLGLLADLLSKGKELTTPLS